jgi:glycosyltransferase involved in cell wall biosynthesis
MVSSLWPPVVVGGAESYAARLATELRGRDHEVAVLTLGVDGADVVAQVHPWPYRLDAWATQPTWKRAVFHSADVYRRATVTAMSAAVERFAPDVVHTHAVQGLSTAALTTPATLGCPHVHSLHDYWLLCQRTTLRTRSGRACRRCSLCGIVSAVRRAALSRSGPDVYLAPSEAVAGQHAANAHISERLRVVHHPVDPAPVRRWTSHRDFAVTFGYIGQLTESKGVRTMLAAFAAHAATVRDTAAGRTRMLVAGTGPLASEVARHAEIGVEALGWVDASGKEDFFDAIDCLVVPSEWEEPAGLVVVEAAARGVPVIGADIGGIPEYVDPASRPLLFASGDSEALARMMSTISVRQARPVGSGVEHLATWTDHAALVVDAYADATARRRVGARS